MFTLVARICASLSSQSVPWLSRVTRLQYSAAPVARHWSSAVAGGTNSSITNNSVNYVRNSIKVVIDAYNGTTRFYLVDPDDPIAQMARVSLASDEPSHEESRLILKRKCEELDLHVRKEVRDAEFEFIANAASCLAAIRNHEELDDEEKQALRARCLRSVKRD
jgi:hypothetical protein